MATYRTLCRRCERYALIGHAYRRWWRVARAVLWRLADHRMNSGGDPITRIANQECTTRAYQTLCDIVAITSPRTSVKRNLWLAWGQFTGQVTNPHGMLRSTRVALDYYYPTGEIRGPKTSRMARVLRGDDNVVVVDTWMARALSVPDKQARNRSIQELAECVIENVKRRIENSTTWFGYPVCYWTPAETQAAVWAGYIRTHCKDGKIPMYRMRDVGLAHTETSGKLLDVSGVPF